MSVVPSIAASAFEPPPQSPPPAGQRFAAPAETYSAVKREQTDLDITLSADADVNPDDKGRASPILVRLYELRAGEAFDSVDYFSLQSNDKQVLGNDLLTRDEFILRPGESRRIQRKSHPDIGAIAVVAGYRDLGSSEWRAIQPIAPGPPTAWYRFATPSHQSKLQVELQRSGVRITPLQ